MTLWIGLGRITIYFIVEPIVIKWSVGSPSITRQAIIWNNVLSIGPLGTNISEILIEILTFFQDVRLEVPSVRWRPICLGLDVLRAMTWPSSLLCDAIEYNVYGVDGGQSSIFLTSLPCHLVLSAINIFKLGQNRRHFPEDIFNTFSGKEMYKLRLGFHWSLLSSVQLTIFKHWLK